MTHLRLRLAFLRFSHDVAYALATMALASASALMVLEIWRAELDAPFEYTDDANLNLMVVKGILDNGWYLENERLGAPMGQELYDFPVVSGDHLNVLTFKLIGLATQEPAVVMNVFFLLTFPLTALTAFLVMRRLGLSAAAALVSGCLYTLLPYHFLRGETHLFLSAYYAVPLAAYLVLAVLLGEPLFARNRSRAGLFSLASGRTVATLAICVVVASASGSFYYSGFAVLLLGAATLLRMAVIGRISALGTGAAVMATIVVVAALNAAPTLVYEHAHGDNPNVSQRQPFESEYYSLRFTQLILPLASHRLELFSRARETYDRWSAVTGIPVTEAGVVALGTIGSLGLLGLFGVTLASAAGLRQTRQRRLLAATGAVTVVAVLIATMGGLSSIIGLLYPQLRSWNRLSVFIAFFALVAVGVALDRAREPVSRLRFGRLISAGGLAAVLVLGVLDQTSKAYVPAYEETAAEYERDRAFVREIESGMPRDAAVFQLPYAPFPESVPAPPGRTVVYDLVRPYLHSESLRWSFGAMQGRPADWAAKLADEPLSEMVAAASALGFDAILVDRLGYDADRDADAIERQLIEIASVQPFRSEDGRHLLFDLRPYNERLRERLSPDQLARLRARVLPQK